MFFVQFSSFRKGGNFAPFDFQVDCLDSEASLKHNEQWTFIKIILISLDGVHTQKNHLALFRLVYLSTITMGLKSHTHTWYVVYNGISKAHCLILHLSRVYI